MIPFAWRSCLCLAFWLMTACAHAANRIGIELDAEGGVYLASQGKPVIAFGPSPQLILTFLPRGKGNDARLWADWAAEHRITHARSYPPSYIVHEPANNVFAWSDSSQTRIDLRKFNASYFGELRKACELFGSKGIFVHLQLWQAVSWNKQWKQHYYNPRNNVNPDLSRHAGPGEFVTTRDPALLDHQKLFVRKVLDATADAGNVVYDIMNEIGNGTGTNEAWVSEILDCIGDWEKEHGIQVLTTLNDEGGVRMGKISLEHPGLELAVKDLGRYDEHVQTRMLYGKPTVSVRNIDWNYRTKSRFYFYGANNLEINTRPDFQSRGRRYWWRMFMAKVQMAGGYADAYSEIHRSEWKFFVFRVLHKLSLQEMSPWPYKPSYALNTVAESNLMHFQAFLDSIKAYSALTVSDSVLEGHPAAHKYCLQSREELVAYLEAPNGTAGVGYPADSLHFRELILGDGERSGFFYDPAIGRSRPFRLQVRERRGSLLVPAFEDDMAIYVD